MARSNSVVIVCLPPHSTHKVHPLDVAFMNPFKTYYAQEIEMWLKAHEGRVITHCQVAAFLGKAYASSATIEVAVNGFRKTEIFPFQPNVFRDHDSATKTTHVDSSLGVQEEHSTCFVMTSDITPVPDFQRPSTRFCLLGDRITTQTKTARLC
jgi:hypothetical protein